MEIWVLKVEGDPHFPKWSFAGILWRSANNISQTWCGHYKHAPHGQVALQPLTQTGNNPFLELIPWKLEMRWHIWIPCLVQNPGHMYEHIHYTGIHPYPWGTSSEILSQSLMCLRLSKSSQNAWVLYIKLYRFTDNLGIFLYTLNYF